MKNRLLLFVFCISLQFVFAQNTIFFFGKSIVSPIYGRFSHYRYSLMLLTMPSTNMNLTRTFAHNKYTLEIGHTDEIFPNPAFNFDALPTLVVDTAYLSSKQYYIALSGRILKSQSEKHHIYASIGGIHRYQTIISTIYKNDYTGFPEFTGEVLFLPQSFGLKSNVSYLFMWKLLAIKTYFGGNYFPRYKDLQLEAGIRIGFCISDKRIKRLTANFMPQKPEK